jgi:hypothetical protein
MRVFGPGRIGISASMIGSWMSGEVRRRGIGSFGPKGFGFPGLALAR